MPINMENMMAMMHGSEMGKGQSMGKHKMDKMKKGDAAMHTEQKMEMMEKRLEMMEQLSGGFGCTNHPTWLCKRVRLI